MLDLIDQLGEIPPCIEVLPRVSNILCFTHG
jgi:hypothetical protein